ncbi:MAG TPA: hypothetical protein VGL91_22490 [Acidobacteriota bacterium]
MIELQFASVRASLLFSGATGAWSISTVYRRLGYRTTRGEARGRGELGHRDAVTL